MGEKVREGRMGKWETAAGELVRFMSIELFFLLFGAGMIFTRYFPGDYGKEIPLNRVDFFPVTVLGAVLAGAGIMAAGNRLLGEPQRAERRLSLLLKLVMGWILVFGLVWIFLSKCDPVSDQMMVITSAQRFAQGNYGRLDYSKYLFMHPHQLGLAAYGQILFTVFGNENLMAFLVFNVLWTGVAAFSGYRITRYLFRDLRVSAYYLLLVGICFPFLLYSSYFYGDVMAAALCLFSVWQTLRWCREEKGSAAVLLVLGISLACLVRNNSLIAAIACLGILLVKAVCGRRWKYLLCIFLAVAGIGGARLGMHAFYESRIGRPLNSGMPMVLYVALGMQEGDKEAGWYNGYSIYTYQDVCGYDGPAAAAIGKAEIKARAKEFLKNPLYGADFFWRKFTSQWCEPTYGCFIMTYATERERSRLVNSIYLGKGNRLLCLFMDSYQLLVYGMGLALLFLTRKEKYPLEWYLLLTVILGGVLFHTIWEAKSRYVLPYFVMMLPLAAAGLALVSGILENWRTRHETAEAG